MARIKKYRENIEVNVFNEHSRSRDKFIYNNIITRDPNVIAQILVDLMILGFPIEKAIRKFREKIRKRDWMGI